MGGKKKQTVGYKYYLGIHFALCYGPIDRLRRILSGDREAWAGNVTSNTTIDIDAPQLFGGDQREGGIVGPAKILMGGATQVCPSDLAALLSAPVPGFRGVTTVYYNGQVTANNPAPKPFAFDVTRILQGWDGGEAWYPEKAPIQVSPCACCDEEMPADEFSFMFVASSASRMADVINPSSAIIRKDAMDIEIAAAFNALIDLKARYGDRLKLNAGIGIWDSARTSTSRLDASIADLEYLRDFYLGIPDGLGNYFSNVMVAVINDLQADLDAGSVAGPRYLFTYTAGADSPTFIDGPIFGTPESRTLAVVAGTADMVARTGAFGPGSGRETTVFRGRLGGLADGFDAAEVHNATTTSPFDLFDAAKAAAFIAQELDGLQPDIFGMNPAHILYECLTDSRWGMGYPASIIDDASFRAASDTLYDECFGLCLMWSAPEALAEFIRRVLNHCGGILYSDPSTGQFALKLIRADYVAGDLPLYDESTVLVLESFQRAGYGELVGEIVVVYHDVETDEDTPIKWQNPATINAQAGLISETREYPGIPTASLAARIAERDGITASTPLARIRFTVNRSAWRLIPGDVFRFSWSKHGLSEVVFRVLSINRGTLGNGQITIEAAEDVFGLPASSYVNQEPTGWEPPDTAPQIITTQTILELPYWTLAIYEGDAVAAALDQDVAYFAPVAARTGGTDLAYRIWSRVGMAAYDDQDLADFVPAAAIAADLDEQATTIALTGAVDLASVVVGDLAFIGEGRDAEWLLINAIDAGAPEITVSRGVLDTTPRAHASGSAIWFTDGKGQEDSTERATGQTVDFKLATISTGGELDYNLATEISETADQRQARPYPPGNVAINGEAWPTLIIDDALTVTWAHRDRLQQTAYVVEQTEGDIGPEAGTTYTVASYDDDSNELLDTSAGISGTSYSPTILDTHRLRIEITAQRAGIDSWQAQIRTFDYVGPDGFITSEFPLEAVITGDDELLITS